MFTNSRKRQRRFFTVFWFCLGAALCLGLMTSGADPVWAAYNYTFGTKVNPAMPSTSQYVYTRGLWMQGQTLYLVYVEASKVKFVKSTDAGVTWSAPVNVYGAGSSQYRPSVVVDNNGYIHVVWGQYVGSFMEAYYARSTNGGASFTDVQSLSGTDTVNCDFPRVDVDNAGRVFAVWERMSTPRQLYVNRSTNSGSSFASKQLLQNTSVAGSGTGEYLTPDIASAGSGVWHVVYGDWDSSLGYRVVRHIRTTDNGSTWSSPVRVSSGYGGTGDYMGTVVDTGIDGRVYAAWHCRYSADVAYNNVYFSRSTDGGATWSPRWPVNDTPEDKSDNVDCIWPSLRSGGRSAPGGDAVIVSWRDTRNTAPGSDGGIYFAMSGNGGLNFSANSPVDDIVASGHAFYSYSSVAGNDKNQAVAAFAHASAMQSVYVTRGHPNDWFRRADPVLSTGPTGSWDDERVKQPWVRRSGTTGQYHMWYCGHGTMSGPQIGFAWSPDGVGWSKYGSPVIPYRNLYPWDYNGVSRPVVLLNPGGGSSSSYFWEAWVTGKCTGNQLRGLYYRGTSPTSWTLGHSSPVLDVGSSGAWDSQAASPQTVIKDGSTYKMWYLGCNGSTDAIGYATSADGINWTKHSGNPIFTGRPDSWEVSIGACHVLYYGGRYRMIYVGGGSPAKLGLARSTDGINWTRENGPGAAWTQTDTPWFGPVGHSWEKRHIIEPYLMKDGNDYYMWYGGDDNTYAGNGFCKIGLATKSFPQEQWTTDSFTLNIPAGSTAAAYKMHGIPLHLPDPGAQAVFGPAIGTYDNYHMRIGRWSPSIETHKEYPDIGEIFYGWAGWFLFRNGLSHTFNGWQINGRNTGCVLGLGWRGACLEPGWNQVANPFNHSVDLRGAVVYDESGENLYYLLSSANNLTQRAFWGYSGGSYSQAASLAAGGGGWVKNMTSSNVTIAFPDTTASFPAPAYDAERAEDLEQPPAPPGAIDGSAGPSGAGGGGGGGGCFVNTAAD